MANYAGYCNKCGKVVFTAWGNKTCPSCGDKTVFQSRTEEIVYQRLNERDKLLLFKDQYPENSPESLKIKRDAEEKLQKELEQTAIDEQRHRERLELIRKSRNVDVTTTDLHEEYEIIGPVFFQVNDAGAAGNFRRLISQYQSEIEEWKAAGQGSNDSGSTLELLGAVVNLAAVFSGNMQDRDLLGNGHSNFDQAFFIAVQELKMRAALLGADAVVGMRQDIDLDTNGFQHFYLQMYGTAVRRKQ